MIPFHRPTRAAGALDLVAKSLAGSVAGGHFNRECDELLRQRLGVSYVTMTPSCTDALELAALLLDVQPGDEVIVPAFTFTSTANGFLLRGAKLVFADIQRDTLNIDPAEIERLITSRTRAIVVMHYAGVACDMDAIMSIADKAGVPVVEDAAHALFGAYRGRALGTIGAMGTFSFQNTKNFTCDEGGAFVTNDPALAEMAEIIREKGTNRSQFMRGLLHKYEWVNVGSSYIMADTLAAQLSAQFAEAHSIQAKRKHIFQRYQAELADWAAEQGVRQPTIPNSCEAAWHLYYLIMPSEEVRDRFLAHLRSHEIGAAFHYVSLNLTPMGRKLGGTAGDAPVSEASAAGLVRPPFFTDLAEADQDRVIEVIRSFKVRAG